MRLLWPILISVMLWAALFCLGALFVQGVITLNRFVTGGSA